MAREIIECACDVPKKWHGGYYKACDACYPDLKRHMAGMQREKRRAYSLRYEQQKRERHVVPLRNVPAPASAYVTPADAERILCVWNERVKKWKK